MKKKPRKFKTVRELFRSENRWCKFALAMVPAITLEGKTQLVPVAVDSPDATKFCLVGALKRVYPPSIRRMYAFNRVQRALEKIAPDLSIAGFNDHPSTTIKDIRKLVKEAKV